MTLIWANEEGDRNERVKLDSGDSKTYQISGIVESEQDNGFVLNVCGNLESVESGGSGGSVGGSQRWL